VKRKLAEGSQIRTYKFCCQNLVKVTNHSHISIGRAVKDINYIEEILRKTEDLKKHSQTLEISESQQLNALKEENSKPIEKKNEEVTTNTAKPLVGEDENVEPPEYVYYQAFKSVENMIAIR
jgi:hypothetical protein